jgi:hypothetical protein
MKTKKKSTKKKSTKKKVILREVTPLPDVPDAYLVKHEVHNVPPPPFHEPLPTKPVEIIRPATVKPAAKSGWWNWWNG